MDIHNGKYICEICNKTYKNRDGIWKHNNKFHTSKNKHEINNNQQLLDDPNKNNQSLINKKDDNEY